jgi:hypothetical protein
MASDVMSLFGLDPNTIQQNRTNKAVSQASAMNPYFAAGAAGGALMGQSVNSMFGLQTPEMAQAQSVKDSMSGADLTTVAGLRSAAQKLMMSGDYAQAMALHAEARDMEADSNVAPRVTGGLKIYVLGDGSEVQAAIVNGAPAMRRNNEWVPLPADAQPKFIDPSAKATTGTALANAEIVLDDTSNFGKLSGEDKVRAEYWVANEAKKLVATGDYDINTAMQEAANRLNSRITPKSGLNSFIPWTDAELNLTGEGDDSATPAKSGTYGTPIGTVKDGYEFTGGDDSVASNWKQVGS